ncbi:MAG: AAA family ATPase [Clostridiales bacterium]|nr:AAA family ATPase [Clostridiales bacterium]
MEKKVKSVIEEVILDDATFRGNVFEPSFVNIFYGKNGVGKSTIARTIRLNNGVRWQYGKSKNDFDILIYDMDFVNDNFGNYRNLAGVFTVSKTNIDIQKKIDEKIMRKAEKLDEYNEFINNAEKKRLSKEKTITDFKNTCWNKTKELRNIFDEAITGKKKISLFGEEILNTKPIAHDFNKLETFYKTVFSKNASTYNLFIKAGKVTYASLSGYELMGKAIVSRVETPFANFIKALNATDWVRQGHSHYTGRTNGKCPYCQRKLPNNFEKEIAACFDAQYQNDINAINKFKNIYISEMENIVITLRSNLRNHMPGLNLDDYETKLKMLSASITINSQIIDKKIKEPTSIAALEDTDSLLLEIGFVIDTLNKEIMANNEIVKDVKTKKTKCKSEVWEYLAFVLKDDINIYKETVSTLEKEINELDRKINRVIDEGRELAREISELNKQVVNTKEAVDGINNILYKSGFQGFRLEEEAGVQNTYRVERLDGSVADKLSEGERNFIAFLYFYYLTKGSYSGESSKDKIVVIDDPVSGMDSSAMFIISALVREMIEICHNNIIPQWEKSKDNYIKQIFILTHNASFHKEISYNQVKRYRDVSFFMIRKTNNVSDIYICTRQNQKNSDEQENYNPVSDSYTALWDEFKEVSSPVAVLNVIHRILNYYFLRLCGYERNIIRDIVLERNKDKFITMINGRRDYTKYRMASYMLNYINNLAGIESELYIQERDDVKQYKEVFKLIFEVMSQEHHYKMMMGIDN